MIKTSLLRWIKKKMPEAIPAPAAIIYNAIPAKILREPEMELAKEVASKIGRGTILDIGSGTGFLATEIAKKSPSVEVIGIDLSREMIRISKRHSANIENVRFELCDAAELPFPDETIDFIISTGSMHHWKRPAKVLNECYRVLKDGQQAWIYDGCSHIPQEYTKETHRKNRLIKYKILSQLLKIHGFTWEEYNDEIREVIKSSEFMKNYQMELLGVWMKIIFTKRK